MRTETRLFPREVPGPGRRSSEQGSPKGRRLWEGRQQRGEAGNEAHLGIPSESLGRCLSRRDRALPQRKDISVYVHFGEKHKEVTGKLIDKILHRFPNFLGLWLVFLMSQ